jgi:hypothetical protein
MRQQSLLGAVQSGARPQPKTKPMSRVGKLADLAGGTT